MEEFEEDEENDDFDKNLIKNRKKNSSNLLKVIFIVIILTIVFFGILCFIGNTIKKKWYIVVIGDIGGKHSNLRLLNMTSNLNEEPIILKDVNHSTIEYDSLELLLKEFISNLKDGEKPEYAIISIPGPVENNTIITLPNIPTWKLDNGNILAEKLGLKKLLFINDFVCNGYAIQTNLTENKDYVILNNVKPKKDGPKLIIGPGTGLGMGFLLKDPIDKYYTIGSSEGGGSDYAPKNIFNLKLREFIKDEVGLENVSLGKICSSHSLIPIYKFLHKYNYEFNLKEFQREKNLFKKIDGFKEYKDIGQISKINSEIINKGLSGECELSRHTLLLFIEILGEIAGDMALFTLPYNGVYLFGRLTRKLTPLILENNIFMNHFKNKDHFWFLLEKIPVYLIQNKKIELVGVTEAARRFLEDVEEEET